MSLHVTTTTSDPVRRTFRLGFPWQTLDPFLFCVHHDDAYPAGNAELGPAASLAGRDIGMDFAGKDGWRMYHGERIPGFPGHPHRGFETVTIVRRGFIDHSDSLGATARFGGGDVQWLTAGKGIVHAEMFPLLDREGPNPLELFQIWLNLPRADKLVEPHFAMLWSKDIPTRVFHDPAGRSTEVTVVAGALAGASPGSAGARSTPEGSAESLASPGSAGARSTPEGSAESIDAPLPAPPPHSWATRAESDVAIWTVRMQPGAAWTLPPARAGTNRVLYVFAGGVRIGGRAIVSGTGVELVPDAAAPIVAGDAAVDMLLLQGRPIGEPVAQHGPFVMNTPDEIRQAFIDYQRTRFGGWPWDSEAPVHPRDAGRFARHADGRVERMP